MRTKTLKKNKINVITLGCSKNVYDSEVLMGQLKASGKEVVHEEEGNIVVINTCGFINNAKEESVNTILDYMQVQLLNATLLVVFHQQHDILAELEDDVREKVLKNLSVKEIAEEIQELDSDDATDVLADLSPE